MNDVDDIKTVVVLQGLGNAGFVCMNIAWLAPWGQCTQTILQYIALHLLDRVCLFSSERIGEFIYGLPTFERMLASKIHIFVV
jgi:hypothetical protein